MTPLQQGQLLASKNVVTDTDITFYETPLRHIRTREVSKYAHQRIDSIRLARSWAKKGGWGRFNRDYWVESAKQSMAELQAMLAALDASGAALVAASSKEGG